MGRWSISTPSRPIHANKALGLQIHTSEDVLNVAKRGRLLILTFKHNSAWVKSRAFRAVSRRPNHLGIQSGSKASSNQRPMSKLGTILMFPSLIAPMIPLLIPPPIPACVLHYVSYFTGIPLLRQREGGWLFTKWTIDRCITSELGHILNHVACVFSQ